MAANEIVREALRITPRRAPAPYRRPSRLSGYLIGSRDAGHLQLARGPVIKRSPWKETRTARRIRSPAPMPGSSRASTCTGSSREASDTILRRKRPGPSPRPCSTSPRS